jgi:phenylpropionate dioxygenase-like ring-hydroxylating dioxygenase large terminal subunit
MSVQQKRDGSIGRRVEPEMMDGGTSRLLRGDPITGERYWSKEWMEKEWERVWKRVWHMGAWLSEIPEPGDYAVHNFRHESVLLVRQKDMTVKAFFNVCQHRGNRLVWNRSGGVPAFTCAYHGWRFGWDGTLEHVLCPENFRDGDPCGRVKLVELPCATWGGFAWYSMDPNARPLLDYLEPMPRLFANRDLDKMVRVIWRKVAVDTNWKFASDNFNESYHLPSVHPMMGVYVDEDYRNQCFEIHANGHNRVVERGQPSPRLPKSEYWDMTMNTWGLDAADFEGRPNDARLALQQQKRKLGPSRGMHYMNKLEDDELTDFFHHTMFPNLTITGTPNDGGVHFFRTEPHVSDPEKCFFEYWALYPRIEGQKEVMTVAGMKPYEEAELESVTYGVDAVGDFLDEDLSVAVQQQRGLHSMGYRDARLTEQESRVRRFHEVLHDYLEGRR